MSKGLKEVRELATQASEGTLLQAVEAATEKMCQVSSATEYSSKIRTANRSI